MPQEDDLLACLLDVAEQELNSLKRQEKSNVQLLKNDENIAQKKKLYKDVDLFSCDVEPNLKTKKEENLSLIHRGDTDSSDDETNKYYESQKYNESGKSIKSLLNHSESSFYDRGDATSSRSSLSSKWKSKQTQVQKQTIIKKNTESLKESSYIVSTDTMFGIRVINPVISSKSLEEKMVGRKVVPILNINNYLKTLSRSDDWVIAGVICNKGTTRTSSKGNQFMIWSITDLLGDIKTVALFLFGSAYEQFWKTQVGSVVGVLNPSILDKRDGSKDEVCRQFNHLCGGLLTKGFIQLEKKHTHIHKLAKSLLPRRPSERRSNALVSRYCEILQGMETRIRMLNVTYMRYIDQHLICFVPGKVLDEIKRLLRLIESRFDPPANNTQLLEELRDLSSMAMEHFDEHILPLLEKKEEVMRYKNSLPSTSKSPEDSKTNKELRKLHKRNRLFKTQVSYLMSKTRRLSEKWNRQNLRIKKQSSLIKEQNAKLQVQATRLENHEITISEMQKKFEELQNNFVDLKTKWGIDVIQKTSNIFSTPDIPPKKEIESNTMTKNIRKMIQQESLRQKHNNILKKLCSRNTADNKTCLNKPPSSSLRRDDSRRKCASMVDMEIWRRRCPTSRLTYSIGHKNYVKNRAEILLNKNQNVNEPHPSTLNTERKTKKGSDFVYKSVIKQRASRVFPLTCLELERKRKSQTHSEIPSKMLKNDMNNSLKAFDLINKYLPGPQQATLPEVEKRNKDNLNIHSYLEVSPTKRRRGDGKDL